MHVARGHPGTLRYFRVLCPNDWATGWHADFSYATIGVGLIDLLALFGFICTEHG
jgi:hypothetical protein